MILCEIINLRSEGYSRHPHVIYIEMLHFLDMFVDVDFFYSASAS